MKTATGIDRRCFLAVASAICIGTAPGSSAAAALEEIVVTATKRGEVFTQDIPIGISAFTGESIEKYNFFSLDDYSRLEPGLQFATRGTGDSQLIIRGIQSPGAATVAFYFDETVMTAFNVQDGGGRTPDIRLHDVERIEILKGPQGTTFGASAMSGAVRVITRKPDATAFDASVSAGGMFTEHGDPGANVSGMINIPLVENVLALRGVAWYEDNGGFIDQFVGTDGVVELEDANDSQVAGGRIMGKWTPNERFSLTAYAQIQEVDLDGWQAFYRKPTGTLVPIPVFAGPFAGGIVGPFGGEFGDLEVTKHSRTPWEDDVHMFGATAEYDLGFADVVATANYFDRDTDMFTDTSPTSMSFGLPPTAVSLQQFQERSILSTELRFSSKFEGPFNFLAGFFYEEDDTFSDLNIIAADPLTGRLPCKGIRECLASPALIPNIVFGRTLEQDLDFFRVFASMTYELTEQWTLGGGVAYFDGELHDVEFTTQGLPPDGVIPPILGGPPQTVPIPRLDEKADTDQVTWDASLAYEPTDDHLLYFRAATGFRPGGINGQGVGAAFGIDVPAAYDPDEVLSLEGGAKTSWFGDRLTVNLAYFKMFWDDMHIRGEEPTGAFEFIGNAAEAEVDGVELEIMARPADPWLLSFGLTWLDARLTADQEFPPGFPVLAGQPRGFKGDPVPKVPEWALSGSAEYTVPMTFLNGVQLVTRANFSYTGPSKTEFNPGFAQYTEIGDYFLMNLGASFYYDNWELRMFLNNVTDERAFVDISAGSALDGEDIFTVRPRSFGAQLNWRFD